MKEIKKQYDRERGSVNFKNEKQTHTCEQVQFRTWTRKRVRAAQRRDEREGLCA